MGIEHLSQQLGTVSLSELREWSKLVSGLSQTFSHLWRILRRDGVYEILEYDSTLELLDPKGMVAMFTRNQKVRFLQDNVIAYQDRAWGDGALFADYACSPGVVADRYKEEDRWNVLISLRETKSRGDIVDFHIKRTVKGGFTEDKEWRQTDILFPVKRLRMSIIFPRDRWCRRAVLSKKNSKESRDLGPRHFMTLPDGRQVLTWDSNNPKLHESYTIQWWW